MPDMPKAKTLPEDVDPKTWRWFSILVIGVFFVLAGSWYLITSGFKFTKPTTAAEFGDTFGVTNALFSGLAFGGVIIAILLQKKELELQREEMRLTRVEMMLTTEELAKQGKYLQEQSTTIRQQKFDSIFFQMLSFHHQIVAAMEGTVNNGAKVVHGAKCFEQFFSCLELAVRKAQRNAHPDDNRKRDYREDIVETGYKSLRRAFESELGHYFRSMYNLLEVVDRSDVADKHFYTNIVRARLSSCEVILLFYHCHVGDNADKFKQLFEKYELLLYIDVSKLLSENHAGWYETTRASMQTEEPR